MKLNKAFQRSSSILLDFLSYRFWSSLIYQHTTQTSEVQKYPCKILTLSNYSLYEPLTLKETYQHTCLPIELQRVLQEVEILEKQNQKVREPFTLRLTLGEDITTGPSDYLITPQCKYYIANDIFRMLGKFNNPILHRITIEAIQPKNIPIPEVVITLTGMGEPLFEL